MDTNVGDKYSYSGLLYAEAGVSMSILSGIDRTYKQMHTLVEGVDLRFLVLIDLRQFHQGLERFSRLSKSNEQVVYLVLVSK